LLTISAVWARQTAGADARIASNLKRYGSQCASKCMIAQKAHKHFFWQHARTRSPVPAQDEQFVASCRLLKYFTRLHTWHLLLFVGAGTLRRVSAIKQRFSLQGWLHPLPSRRTVDENERTHFTLPSAPFLYFVSLGLLIVSKSERCRCQRPSRLSPHRCCE
jgi:hypothetical protein